jgi:hypothetical protein
MPEEGHGELPGSVRPCRRLTPALERGDRLRPSASRAWRGPGKPTSIRQEDLQAWCTSEGLAIPLEALERSERSERSERLRPELRKQLTEIVEQAVKQEIGQAVERLERSLTQVVRQALSQTPVGPAPAAPPRRRLAVPRPRCSCGCGCCRPKGCPCRRLPIA